MDADSTVQIQKKKYNFVNEKTGQRRQNIWRVLGTGKVFGSALRQFLPGILHSLHIL